MLLLKNFPKDFLWGTATSAYQIEGASAIDGRSPSIWDIFCSQPGKVYQNQTGDHACEHYYRWQEDIQLMKALGVNAYRFSISWSRIYPNSSKTVNQKGIDFYSRIIDKLLENHIEPFITLFHWDLPQYIQDAGGWVLRETCERFQEYACTMIRSFGDRVRYWTTINEPSVIVYSGHLWGTHAPGIHSSEIALQTLHHLLLAHGLALQAIRSLANVKAGITLNFSSVFPNDSNSERDRHSASLYDTYLYRSFLDALFYKKYPEEMGMEKFAIAEDMQMIGEPMDYIGVNYYTTSRVAFDEQKPLFQGRAIPSKPNPQSDMWEFFPAGLSKVIERIWLNYSQMPIYILENGTSLKELENDSGRIDYLKAHMNEVSKCLKKNIDIKGYFVWSLMDNFEWAEGYSKRFGLISVDFETFERKFKNSAYWYADIIQKWKTIHHEKQIHHRGTENTENKN